MEGLKECGKIQNTVRDLKEVVKRIQEKGMQVMGGFIVGFDSDTSSIFDSQIKFIQQTGVVQAMVGLLTALPQTQLWHRLKKEGRLTQDASGNNTDGSLNFIPKMNKKELIEGYQKILSTIYGHKEYYQRIQTFIKSYNPTVKGKISKNDVIAFIRSTWTIGIVSKARFQYWKLLTKTFFTKIKAIPVAVELAIMGHHFEKLITSS